MQAAVWWALGLLKLSLPVAIARFVYEPVFTCEHDDHRSIRYARVEAKYQAGNYNSALSWQLYYKLPGGNIQHKFTKLWVMLLTRVEVFRPQSM